jgi:hypothetical protein
MEKNWKNFLFHLDYYTGIYLERMRKTTANIIQDVLRLGKYLTVAWVSVVFKTLRY